MNEESIIEKMVKIIKTNLNSFYIDPKMATITPIKTPTFLKGIRVMEKRPNLSAKIAYFYFASDFNELLFYEPTTETATITPGPYNEVWYVLPLTKQIINDYAVYRKQLIEHQRKVVLVNLIYPQLFLILS